MANRLQGQDAQHTIHEFIRMLIVVFDTLIATSGLFLGPDKLLLHKTRFGAPNYRVHYFNSCEYFMQRESR